MTTMLTSDIPHELQDLLAGHAVRGVDDEPEVYGRSIPGDASALRSEPLLESFILQLHPGVEPPEQG